MYSASTGFPEPRAGATCPEPVPARRPVVLCVDDDALVLQSLARLLRRERYHLVTTGDPRVALEWLGRHPVDLLIADQRMPGVSGTELIREARARCPGVPFVMLTGYPDSDVVRARLNREIRRLVTKPWDNEELRTLIRELLDEPAAGGPEREGA